MRAQGSLCLHQGVLWVGRWAKTAHVRAFDLDGRSLEAGFSFRDEASALSTATALAVDEERRIWVADASGRRVRCFNLFGAEVGGLARDDALEQRVPPAGSERERGDLPGALGEPVALAVGGAELLGAHVATPATAPGTRPQAAPVVVLGSGGQRRHALQAFDLESGRWLASLKPEEGARGRFREVRRVVAAGSDLWVVEQGRARVLVYRRGEFHYAFGLRGERREPLAVCAAAPLPDGRVVAAWDSPEGGLGLFDATGQLERVLAPAGEDEGCVEGPEDLVLEPGPDERHTRVAVLDRVGLRVQVFTLAGRCFGAFEERVS